MGVSQDSTFVLSDKLVYVPINITMEEAVASAYRHRPDLLGKEFGDKTAERASDNFAKLLLPDSRGLLQ